MPRIQCMLGARSDIYVGSTPYNFTLDEHGRAVADVDDRLHVQCFISLEHYRLVPDDMILGETAAPPVSLEDADDSDDSENTDDDPIITATVTGPTPDLSTALGIQLPEGEGSTGEENGGSGDNSDADADNTGGTSDTDAPEGNQDGQQGEGQGETPPPAGETGEQSKAPEGEGEKADAPKPEKKRAGRPKKTDAAAKPNAE
nr:hypothetical protein [Brucella anthropi]